jgi:hypothetical protein
MNMRTQKRTEGRPTLHWLIVSRVRSRRARRASTLVVACWLTLNSSLKAQSRNQESEEYPVKLAFLYNFTKFVEWPPRSYGEAGSPLTICIVGDDPFSPDLEGELQTREVRGHPVKIKKLKPDADLNACQIVFVPLTAETHAISIVMRLKRSNTLTIGETEGFAMLGGIINLTIEENKLHFEVNPIAADRAGLKISSKLLSLAKIVKEQD